MAKYIKDFVTGYGINFQINKRNVDAFQRSTQKWQDIYGGLNISADSIIMICGAKNNGKSSLIRYITKSYFEQQVTNREEGVTIEENQVPTDINDRFVYFVDFDPGQAEMTTPGIVSAHIIKSSDGILQTPTYLNLGRYESLIMSSVGGTNMSVNPSMYIENCRFVLAKVKEHQSQQIEKRPILINTMGHIRNVGLAMLTDLIKICKPTNLIVLNVESDPMRTVYADLSPMVISNVPASFYYETTKSRDGLLNYVCDLHNLDFAFVDSSSTATKNRTAMQIAYFAQIPETLYKPVMQVEAKWLSFDKISIYCVSSYPLKENIVLELLYHSWIHLTKLKKERIRPTIATSNNTLAQQEGEQQQQQQLEGEPICNIIDDVGENQLFGCGMVADIDLVLKRMAIITPLDDRILQSQVNCIVKPLSIQTPRQLMLDSNHE